MKINSAIGWILLGFSIALAFYDYDIPTALGTLVLSKLFFIHGDILK